MTVRQQRYVCFSPLDVHFPDVPHGHDLQIIGVGIDQHAIRIDYRITPALPSMRPPEPRGSDWQPPLTWDWQATDEVGRSYMPAGGAYGASSDGHATAGVLSLTPLPALGRHTLHIALTRGGSRCTSSG